MLDKQDLLKADQLQQLKEQQQEGHLEQQVFTNAYLDQEQRNQDAQASQFRFWGVTHKDSRSMSVFKEAMNQVTQFMSGTMPLEESAFQEQLAALKQHYSVLIRACEHYIKSHPKPYTASGQARLHMVRNALSMAQRDSEQLERNALEVHQLQQPDVAWATLLNAARGVSIRLKEDTNVQTGGAGTSELLIISSGDRKVFFKEDEALLKPSEEIQRQYIDTCKDAHDLAILKELQNIMPDSLVDRACATFKNAGLAKNLNSEDAQIRQRTLLSLQKSLAVLGIRPSFDFQDERVLHFLQELTPRYSKWVTRYQLCEVAKIAPGSLLSTRNVAASRMAKLLNISDLVAASSNSTIVEEETDTIHHGIAMAEAVGQDYGKVKSQATRDNLTVVHTPEAVRQLSCLQMFDVLCCQIDRNSSNFFASHQEVDGKSVITGIQGIDNDLAFGTVSYQELNENDGGFNWLPVFETKGTCTLPALDGNMTASLMALKDEVVRFEMKDLLSEDEINSMLDRLHGMQDTITRSLAQNPNLVVASDRWDAQVAERFRSTQVNRAYARFQNSGL